MSHDTSYYLIEVVTKAGLTVCHEYLYIKTGRVKRDTTIWNTGCILFKNYDIVDGVFSSGMQKFNINNYKQLWKIGHIRRHDIEWSMIQYLMVSLSTCINKHMGTL
jgi:hypothetical protein